MAEKLLMPRLGQSMEEGTIVRWYKAEGESVRRGESLLEVMTDKANIDVESPADGILRRILSQADETVPVNAVIAVITSAEEEIAEDLGMGGHADARTAAAQPALPNPPIHVSPRARRLADEHRIPVETLAGIGSGPQGRVVERDVANYLERQRSLERQLGALEPPALVRSPRVSPLAARIADDAGLDVQALAAGLPGSRIMADDVRRRVEGSSGVGMSAAPGELAIAEIIPFRGLRKIVAENVTKSRFTAPHVTLTAEADMTEAAANIARLRPEVEQSYGVKLTYTDLFVKIAARALADHPLCNAALVGDEIRVYSDRNIGVAVATASSLIVPVLRAANRKSLGEISAELKDLVDRCRTGKQTPEDLAGATFTITNLGAFGVDLFDPVIVPPQSCILGIGRIADKPIALNGSVVIRPMMNLCLSFDHRVLDGAPAARFMQRLKELVESPVSAFV